MLPNMKLLKDSRERVYIHEANTYDEESLLVNTGDLLEDEDGQWVVVLIDRRPNYLRGKVTTKVYVRWLGGERKRLQVVKAAEQTDSMDFNPQGQS